MENQYWMVTWKTKDLMENLKDNMCWGWSYQTNTVRPGKLDQGPGSDERRDPWGHGFPYRRGRRESPGEWDF